MCYEITKKDDYPIKSFFKENVAPGDRLSNVGSPREKIKGQGVLLIKHVLFYINVAQLIFSNIKYSVYFSQVSLRICKMS